LAQDRGQGRLTYKWDSTSTYVQNPPYFSRHAEAPVLLDDIIDARVLGLFLDSITTDHISPAGSIRESSPPASICATIRCAAGLQPIRHAARQPRSDDARHLRQYPHQEPDGAGRRRRRDHPLSRQAADADLRRGDALQAGEVPLVVFAGKEYGTGSSRDWAAKGNVLLGIRAVVAQSFERIHRSNLVGMGVCRWCSRKERPWQSLGLKGSEHGHHPRIARRLKPRQKLIAKSSPRRRVEAGSAAVPHRYLDELEYFKNGGILQYVLRHLAALNQHSHVVRPRASF
jgi:aconitate hydratase